MFHTDTKAHEEDPIPINLTDEKVDFKSAWRKLKGTKHERGWILNLILNCENQSYVAALLLFYPRNSYTFSKTFNM